MKTRIFQTKFWEDDFVGKLSPHAKLLFVFLLTNSMIGFTGAYECPDRNICFYTGLGAQELAKAKRELTPKVDFMENGWIIIKNAQRYNNYRSNAKLEVAYQREENRLPKNIKEIVLSYYYDTQAIPDINIKPKTITNTEEGQGGEEVIEIHGMSLEEAFSDRSQSSSKIVRPTKSNEFSEPFLTWWNIYPKKVGKRDANRAWEKNVTTPDMEVMVIKDTERRLTSKQWLKNDGDFVPNPVTYINGHRWEDEVEVTKKGYSEADLYV